MLPATQVSTPSTLVISRLHLGTIHFLVDNAAHCYARQRVGSRRGLGSQFFRILRIVPIHQAVSTLLSQAGLQWLPTIRTRSAGEFRRWSSRVSHPYFCPSQRAASLSPKFFYRQDLLAAEDELAYSMRRSVRQFLELWDVCPALRAKKPSLRKTVYARHQFFTCIWRRVIHPYLTLSSARHGQQLMVGCCSCRNRDRNRDRDRIHRLENAQIYPLRAASVWLEVRDSSISARTAFKLLIRAGIYD
jgi:hypothetical protein